MADTYDVAIVGARCAGAALATALARDGVSVCLLDHARFPSDTASTHIVQPSGVQLMAGLGVRAEIGALAAEMNALYVVLDDAGIQLRDAADLFGEPVMNIRRITLDAILLDAAARAGADVRTRSPVTGLLADRGRVTGVRTPTGDVQARIVVGADGVNSTVARHVGATEYCVTPPGRVFVWSYLDAPEAPADRMWFGKIGDCGYLASPTDGGAFMAVAGLSITDRHELRTDREAVYFERLQRWPELADAITGARRVGPLRTVLDWHGYFRTSAGPGWVLVGDAGHFKDPTPGQGITDALRQAHHLATAVRRGLDGPDPDGPLREWWQWRDADAWDMYWFAALMGASGPTPSVVQEFLRRVAQDRRLTLQLFRVLNHEQPSSEFARPTRMAAATARVLLRGRNRSSALPELGSLIRDGAAQQREKRRLARRYRSAHRRVHLPDQDLGVAVGSDPLTADAG